jgi:hypothetical protein
VARYSIRASNSAGTIEFPGRLTITEALNRAAELRDAHFEHITLVNLETGLEISDLESLVQENKDDS